MSIRQYTCYVVECDTPGCDGWDDADYKPHSDSEKGALDYAVNSCHWTHKDGVTLCEKCSDRLHCEQNGHRWWQWGGDPDTGVANESCERCDAHRLVATSTSA